MSFLSRWINDSTVPVAISPFSGLQESEYIKNKRAEAIAKLGDKWMMHPDYKRPQDAKVSH